MPDSCNPMFLYKNLVVGVSTSLTYQNTDYPLNNMLQREMWKFGGVDIVAGNTCFWGTLGLTAQVSRAISIQKINWDVVDIVFGELNDQWQWRVILTDDDPGGFGMPDPVTPGDLTAIYDSGYINCRMEDTIDEGSGDSPGDYYQAMTHVYPQAYTATFAVVFIRPHPDSSGVPLGPFLGARFICGPVLEAAHAIGPGSGLTHSEDTSSVLMESGAMVFGNRRIRRRGLKFVLDGLTRDELYQTYGSLVVKKGYARDFVGILRPDDPSQYHFEVCLGTIEERSVQALYTGYDQISTSFTMRESL